MFSDDADEAMLMMPLRLYYAEAAIDERHTAPLLPAPCRHDICHADGNPTERALSLLMPPLFSPYAATHCPLITIRLFTTRLLIILPPRHAQPFIRQHYQWLTT